MADPKDLAAQLEAFNQIEAQGQPWYKKQLPMEGRATFLPFRDTMEGSVFNQRELAMPGVLASALNAFTSPERARTGSDTQFNPNEEAINFAQNVMGGGVGTSAAMKAPMGQGGKDLAMNAWHGSPHNIEGKFDIAKVGTGEGAQAYGHGMYFAENPNVAKEYQKMLSGPDQTAADYLKMYKTPSNAISVLEEGITPNLTPEAKKYAQDAIDVLKSGKELKGNLYKVDIPDAQIPMMMDWDKHLSEQSPQVKAILEKYQKELGTSFGTGQQVLKEIAFDRRMKGLDDSPAAVSKQLNDLGITGIRYIDEQSRGINQNYVVNWPNFGGYDFPTLKEAQAFIKQHPNEKLELIEPQKATSNFVVFKPETVKILEKNDKPVSRKELLKQEFDKLEK